jgi:hypothetical protein
MPEPEDNEDVSSHRIVTETVHASSSRGTGITIAIIAVVAIALIVWVVMQMK